MTYAFETGYCTGCGQLVDRFHCCLQRLNQVLKETYETEEHEHEGVDTRAAHRLV